MTQTGDSQLELEIMSTWPTFVQLNVFGYDNFYYGDVDNVGVLDLLPPNTDAPVYCNLSAPPKPHISWMLVVNDADLTWSLEPRGQSSICSIMYALLLSILIMFSCRRGVHVVDVVLLWYHAQQMGRSYEAAHRLLPDLILLRH
jgi:alpha-1,3-glucan synthase